MRTLPIWLARIALTLVFLTHGMTKLTRAGDFETKFDLSQTVTILAAVAELAGVLGMILGGLAIERFPLWSLVATWVGMVCIAIVQVGAIITVHWGNGWFYHQSGVEFNVVLLLICATVASGTWFQYDQERRAGELAQLIRGSDHG